MWTDAEFGTLKREGKGLLFSAPGDANVNTSEKTAKMFKGAPYSIIKGASQSKPENAPKGAPVNTKESTIWFSKRWTWGHKLCYNLCLIQDFTLRST